MHIHVVHSFISSNTHALALQYYTELVYNIIILCFNCREYNPHLPRSEVQQVDSLRDDWKALTDHALQVQYKLLSEQRLLFEREVDKQVKAFVVETIQFRNSFDSEGPLVPGLIPSEAVSRLGKVMLCLIFVWSISSVGRASC